MDSLFNSYLQIIKDACTDSNTSSSFSEDTFSGLFSIAQKQKTLPFLLPYAENSHYFTEIKRQAKSMMLNYYQLEQFARYVITLFQENNISCILLKGISLAACYPVPEYRKLGDLDLLLTDPQTLQCTKKLLIQHGFREDDEISDHHATFIYTYPQSGRTCILELHYRIVGLYQYAKANQIVDSVFSASRLQIDCQTINGVSYPVLPPTEYTFYLLHHMLKHYLYSGFGIRLMCDFMLYIMRHQTEIDCSQLHHWCMKSKIFHFYEIVVESCRTYLGLSQSFDSNIHYDLHSCELFMDQILSGEDMGNNDGTKLVGSGSYRHIGLSACLKEGHLQMQVRFPKLSKYFILWPFLWICTFFCFLKNTYTRRNTTLFQTLKDFKSDNQKSQLLHIFDNSERQK